MHACDGQTEFSSQYRVCITCSAVKTVKRYLSYISSSSSSSTNFIATQVLNKPSGPLCVTYYITLMSMLLWPIVCVAVWSTEQFRLQCTLECPSDDVYGIIIYTSVLVWFSLLKSYCLSFLSYASEAVLLSNSNITYSHWITVLIVQYLRYLVLTAMIVFKLLVILLISLASRC